MKKSKLIPLSVPNLSLDILENVKDTIETGWVSTGGRFISEFEEKIAQYVGVEKAISTQSGTAGLHLALKVLDVSSDDEVIVPTLTFIAAVNPVKYVGAEPIFMDCDETLNMDMDKLEIFLNDECDFINNKTINKKTRKHIKALIIVHVFGNPANMDKLMHLASEFNLKIVEDATEALGSFFLDGKFKGKHCGTIGDIGVYSFNANKIITTGGGGMIVSNDLTLLDKANFLGVQAKTDSLYFVHDEIGYNYRMTNIQAAFGKSQVDKLEEFITTKISNYNLYKNKLAEIDGLRLLSFRDDCRCNHWFYSVIVDSSKYGMNRDQLLNKLIDNNIQSRPVWRLIHKQKPYLQCQTFRIEKALRYEESLLNIPCSSNLLEEDLERVIQILDGKEMI
ncbi:LegC family aminotransferase [Mycoplasmatota bacterium zrk1]